MFVDVFFILVCVFHFYVCQCVVHESETHPNPFALINKLLYAITRTKMCLLRRKHGQTHSYILILLCGFALPVWFFKAWLMQIPLVRVGNKLNIYTSEIKIMSILNWIKYELSSHSTRTKICRHIENINRCSIRSYWMYVVWMQYHYSDSQSDGRW